MKHKFWVLCCMLFIAQYASSQDLLEYKFRVEGACGMCQDRIEKNAKKIGKAKSASWDVDSKILTVEVDESKTSVSEIKYHLAQAGHDNGDFTAPQDVYDQLHFCCKYRPDDAQHIVEHQDGSQHEQTLEEHGHVHVAEGYIYAMENGEKVALIGANIIFEGANEGTTTDLDGFFKLENTGHHDEIRVSYIGYEDQVIRLEDRYIEVTMADGHQLEVVEISYRKRTTEVSFVNSINVESISREELCKAACCNLSESFETNPSVDVSFSDAITGTKQIQMLGLAGPYVQITRELIPDVRTMNTVYGLNTTPGPWIESIQLIKGTGSVVNGFESFTGQINVELKKPEKGERLHINGFANNGGRIELNTNFRADVTDNIATGILFHGKNNQSVHDRNDDGFMDMPQERDFVVANRWKFRRKKNIEAQFGVKYSNLNHTSGYHDHFSGDSQDHANHWRMNTETRRIDVWSKTGYIWPENPERSIGLQLSGVIHDQKAEYGFKPYDTEERSFYSNLIFQNIFDNGHILRTGLTYQLDDIYERVGKSPVGFHERKESVPGAYVEYTIKDNDKWAIIPGLRVDKHNNYGTFVTPRLHAKYNLSDQSIVRLTAGRGQRTANIFAENMALFASSRGITFINPSTDDIPYGLEAEVAWNYGINYTQGFRVAEKEMVFALDIYRTSFENQIVADFENPVERSAPRNIYFYNLEGQSFSNSLQVKLDYEPVENLDLRIAYRMFDVQTTYEGQLLEKPFVSKHRAFLNAAYKTKSDWHFDTTLNWRGSQRLPSTAGSPVEFQRLTNSPSYFLANAQISKRWGDGKFDIYLGGENLFNYQQKDAIISAEDAFGPFFDASNVWAPLFGTNVYIGFRYNLAMKKEN